MTITRNEILTGLNTDHWILALVEVRPDGTQEVRYLYHPFRGRVDDLGFTETSRTFPGPSFGRPPAHRPDENARGRLHEENH